MAKNKHITYNERVRIEEGLNEGLSFKKISKTIDKNCSTISKEVRLRKEIIQPSCFNNSFNQCKLRQFCKKKNVCKRNCDKLCKNCKKCNEFCLDFNPIRCDKLKLPPYVCNGCDERKKCRMQKEVYKAKEADIKYKETLTSSRIGVNNTPDGIKQLEEVIVPLIKNGHSPAMIIMNNPQLNISEKTIYNYIENGVFSEIGNIDLPRKVKYKPRNKNEEKEPRNDAVRIDRTYEDYLSYKQEHPNALEVQTDTVEGKKGGKCLFTIIFTNCNFMIAFLIESQRKQEIIDKFNFIKKAFKEKFILQFEIILTDNGKEFKGADEIEYYNVNNKSHLFYCDPGKSYQKPKVENNHEFIRRVLPKGTSFDNLTDEDVILLMSHINAVPREELNGNTPYDLACLLIGENIISNFCFKVEPNDVILKPSLLKK